MSKDMIFKDCTQGLYRTIEHEEGQNVHCLALLFGVMIVMRVNILQLLCARYGAKHFARTSMPTAIL